MTENNMNSQILHKREKKCHGRRKLNNNRLPQLNNFLVYFSLKIWFDFHCLHVMWERNMKHCEVFGRFEWKASMATWIWRKCERLFSSFSGVSFTSPIADSVEMNEWKSFPFSWRNLCKKLLKFFLPLVASLRERFFILCYLVPQFHSNALNRLWEWSEGTKPNHRETHQGRKQKLITKRKRR